MKRFQSEIFLPSVLPSNAASLTLPLLSVKDSLCQPAGGVAWDRAGILLVVRGRECVSRWQERAGASVNLLGG